MFEKCLYVGHFEFYAVIQLKQYFVKNVMLQTSNFIFKVHLRYKREKLAAFGGILINNKIWISFF